MESRTLNLIVLPFYRQAEILERKRQKKIRQKEQKGRELLEDDTEIKGNINSTAEAVLSAEASLVTCVFEALNHDTFADHSSSPHAAACNFPDIYEGADSDTQSGYECGTDQNIEQQTSQGHSRRPMMVARRQGLPKSQWASPYSQLSKHGVIQKYGTNRDQRATSITNGMKVWSRKPKPEIDGMGSKARLLKEPDKRKNHEVLIGSISVTLGNCSQSMGSLVPSHGDDMVENPRKQNTAQEKPMKSDYFESGNNRLTVKLWRPVGQHRTKDPSPLQNGTSFPILVLKQIQEAFSPAMLPKSFLQKDGKKLSHQTM
ncbi:hypothetical protein PIB30_116617 [Stylosanthes scabra]|uniref:Uncharacterized protein n=1 Tax=Stylosanthes scabra TaxID=79078 RepID=A0ABU6RB78_9FABA|nr:hypothetical protein [Stylosanthes scabra]